MENNIKLEDLGYSDFFDNKRRLNINKDYIPARIIAVHKDTYIVRNEVSEFSAKITGKMMFTASSREDYPAVGDWVLITIHDENQAIIHEILPRKTILKRKTAGKSGIQIIASNVDIAFIIQSPDRDYSLNRFERFFSLANSGNIKPAIILNKIDLISESEKELKMSEIKSRFNDTDIFFASAVSGKNIDSIKEFIKKGQTYCFLGSSGVGKSSLINKLIGKDIIKTGDISLYANRGKHVTTHRQLFILDNGGLVVDNPGMREVGLIDAEQGVDNVFKDILELSDGCKYSDCTHMHEPGCAILEAVKTGGLDKKKYNNYSSLSKENEYQNMSNLEKRRKDKSFGKFIKKTKEYLKKHEHE